MCRGFQQIDQRDRLLKIKAFYLSLSLPNSNSKSILPDSLTLHYLPRITGGPLEINDSVFRPDSPAFLTLHRLLSDRNSVKSGRNSVTYGSREKVRVSEGVRFEVYLMEERLVRGGFRKDDEGEWKMECRCGLEGEMAVEVAEVEVCVAVDGGGGGGEVMKEAVEMVVRRRRKRGIRCFEGLLEEIPEQREEAVEEYCCCCCDCGGEVVEDGGDTVEMEVEGVRWAVDVGIWVVCLGVGYFVSKASMRRKRRLL